MGDLGRRSALKVVAFGAVAAGASVVGDEQKAAPKLWTLEGVLKVHPKFVYRYFISLLDGQKCGLYGPDHAREPEQLGGIELSTFVRVRGVLGTEYHPSGTKENPSPFGPGWTLFMDVHEAEKLK